MMADLPSGVKYMLYGSSTTSGLAAGLPVRGSMAVTLPVLRRSALLFTHRVRMSHEGTMCCGAVPTLNLSINLSVLGS